MSSRTAGLDSTNPTSLGTFAFLEPKDIETLKKEATPLYFPPKQQIHWITTALKILALAVAFFLLGVFFPISSFSLLQVFWYSCSIAILLAIAVDLCTGRYYLSALFPSLKNPAYLPDSVTDIVLKQNTDLIIEIGKAENNEKQNMDNYTQEISPNGKKLTLSSLAPRQHIRLTDEDYLLTGPTLKLCKIPTCITMGEGCEVRIQLRDEHVKQCTLIFSEKVKRIDIVASQMGTGRGYIHSLSLEKLKEAGDTNPSFSSLKNKVHIERGIIVGQTQIVEES